MISKRIIALLFISLVSVSFLTFNTLQLQATMRSLASEKQLLEETNNQLNQQLQESIKRVRDLEKQKTDGPSSAKKTAYLTFDDGPSANTAVILDTLARYQVKATFFVIANSRPENIALYHRIVDEGHALGLHGYMHDYATAYQSVDAYMNNLLRLQDFLFQTVGQRPVISRFLGGSNNTMAARYGTPDLMKQLTARLTTDGFPYFDWNVSSVDTSRPLVEEDVIVSTVLAGAKRQRQAVILMHDAPMKTTTASSLPRIIEGLKTQGFRFDVLKADTPAVHFPQK